MLTTRFEELKMGDDESFDSFYGKLNEIVIVKLNLREKIEDAKVVRKILRSLPKSFRVKVTTTEESKDLEEIKIQELKKFRAFTFGFYKKFYFIISKTILYLYHTI